MRASSLVKLTLVVGVVSVLVGCTSLFNSNRNGTPPLKADSVSEPLSTLGDSCSTAILEPDRSALLQEALTDSQLHAVKAQLESRGVDMNIDEAQAVQLVGGEQVLIPFGNKAHLVWTRTDGQTAALGLVRQGNKTVNISANGEERIVRFLSPEKVQKLLSKLREKPKFQEFEGKLQQKGKLERSRREVDWNGHGSSTVQHCLWREFFALAWSAPGGYSKVQLSHIGKLLAEPDDYQQRGDEADAGERGGP